jgi:hypothetical protein
MPGHQFLDSIDGMLGDFRQDGTKIKRRVEPIQFGSSDETVERRRSLAARIGRQFIMPEFWHAKSLSHTRFTHLRTRASSFSVNTSTMESPIYSFAVRTERRIYFRVGWRLPKQVL